MPCRAPFFRVDRGRIFSESPFALTGILKSTQCTHVPRGASGSSTISARVFVPFGIPDHSSGGDTFSPSHVYFFGIISPSLKAALITVISIAAPPFAGDASRSIVCPEKRRTKAKHMIALFTLTPFVPDFSRHNILLFERKINGFLMRLIDDFLPSVPQPRCDPVDAKENCLFDVVLIRLQEAFTVQTAQKFNLNVAQGVDIGISKLDRPP